MTATLTTPIAPEQAEAWMRDLLEQAGPWHADALRWKLAGSLVGPLEFDGRAAARYGLRGIVGTIDAMDGGETFVWSVTSVGVEHAPRVSGATDLDGEAPHFREADAALCEALRALGWHCMEAP
jgi:hypothetical protein